MDHFARIVVGYHGCRRPFAERILSGRLPISEWQRSQNTYDWLGEGVYFWEHAPIRALRWANERYGEEAAVIGAMIQLGMCFDLMDEVNALLLAKGFQKIADYFAAAGVPLPVNRGVGQKIRELDCAAINECLDRIARRGFAFDTVRGAFLEGPPIFPGTTLSAETHIQVAVRNTDCILGVFWPNLD